MHIMNCTNYSLADGFIYSGDNFIDSLVFPKRITLCFRMFNPCGIDYVSFGLTYKHPEDNFSKSVGRKLAYTRLFNELELFDLKFNSLYNASKENGDDAWRYSNFIWNMKTLLSFTVSLDELLKHYTEYKEVPRYFSPNYFKSLNASNLKTNFTDQLFYDVADQYIFDLLTEKGYIKVKKNRYISGKIGI